MCASSPCRCGSCRIDIRLFSRLLNRGRPLTNETFGGRKSDRSNPQFVFLAIYFLILGTACSTILIRPVQVAVVVASDFQAFFFSPRTPPSPLNPLSLSLSLFLFYFFYCPLLCEGLVRRRSRKKAPSFSCCRSFLLYYHLLEAVPGSAVPFFVFFCLNPYSNFFLFFFFFLFSSFFFLTV